MQLTPHFALKEFMSKDGAPFPSVVRARLPLLAQMLEQVRTALSEEAGTEVPVKVLSGYRSPAWNAAVGGVANSYHLRGLAADITTALLSPGRVQAVCRKLQARGIVGGLGAYPGFTHVDLGPRRSWTPPSREAKGGAPT